MFLFFVLYHDLMPSAKKHGIQVQDIFWLCWKPYIKGVTPGRRGCGQGILGFSHPHTPPPPPIDLFGSVSI